MRAVLVARKRALFVANRANKVQGREVEGRPSDELVEGKKGLGKPGAAGVIVGFGPVIGPQ